MNFYLFLKHKNYLVEGGNAVSNVVKIEAKNVKPTFETYYKKVLKPIGLLIRFMVASQASIQAVQLIHSN